MIQLNMFEKLPHNVIQTEWIRDHIKSLPPVNVTEDQKKQAQQKIQTIKQIKISKLNLS